MNLDRQFSNILSTPLTNLSVEEFKPIALGIWHENYTPSLDQLQSDRLSKAGYFIDRLMRFNCVSRDRKLELLELLHQIWAALPETVPTVSSLNVEPLAQKWNQEEDISHLIQPLLKYQTRHYQHTSQSSFKSASLSELQEKSARI